VPREAKRPQPRTQEAAVNRFPETDDRGVCQEQSAGVAETTTYMNLAVPKGLTGVHYSAAGVFTWVGVGPRPLDITCGPYCSASRFMIFSPSSGFA
jgi:hypothetical protein